MTVEVVRKYNSPISNAEPSLRCESVQSQGCRLPVYMTMTWQPSQEGIQQLSELLKDSLSNERNKQKLAEQVDYNFFESVSKLTYCADITTSVLIS